VTATTRPRSRYIAFEGIDGAGKSTVATRFGDSLEARGETVVRVREPGGTPVGERIRKILLGHDLEPDGRYGPYIKWGSETRSLEGEEQIFSIDLDAAVTLLAQPKTRGRRAAAPLRELGDDPNSEKPIVVKSGRYGPYVTDGETNASLRTADTVEAISLDRAVELLAERRAKGPPKKNSADDDSDD